MTNKTTSAEKPRTPTRFPPMSGCNDVAQRWHVHPLTIRRMASKGEIPCHMVGVQYRFTAEDCEQIEEIFSQPATATPAHRKLHADAEEVQARQKAKGRNATR